MFLKNMKMVGAGSKTDFKNIPPKTYPWKSKVCFSRSLELGLTNYFSRKLLRREKLRESCGALRTSEARRNSCLENNRENFVKMSCNSCSFLQFFAILLKV
jgi:hypothetical protein